MLLLVVALVAEVSLGDSWMPHPVKALPIPVPRPHCFIAADLTPDPDVRFEEIPGVVPADLPGPRFDLPKRISIDLGQDIPPPAPNYSHLYLGEAEIDTVTGAITINGTDFSPRPIDCP